MWCHVSLCEPQGSLKVARTDDWSARRSKRRDHVIANPAYSDVKENSIQMWCIVPAAQHGLDVPILHPNILRIWFSTHRMVVWSQATVRWERSSNHLSGRGRHVASIQLVLHGRGHASRLRRIFFHSDTMQSRMFGRDFPLLRLRTHRLHYHIVSAASLKIS
jgi:hypothetical protein